MSDDFHLDEYRALRAEVLDRIKACHDLERFAAAGAAAVYAWVASARLDPRPGGLILLLPILFGAFGALRSSALIRQLKVLGGYLAALESKYVRSDDPLMGWQKYREVNEKRFRQDFALQFWLAFLGISIALSAAMYFTIY